MKKMYLLAVVLFAAISVQAQDVVKFAPLDASPVDISYFPNKAVKFKKTDNTKSGYQSYLCKTFC